MSTEKELREPRRPGELVFCSAMLLLSATALYLSYRISGFSSWSSAGSMPLGTSLVMFVSSLTIIFRELAKAAPTVAPGHSLAAEFVRQIFPARHLVFVVVLVAYMFLLEPLGFITSSFLYLVISSIVLGERRIAHLLVVNVLSLAAVYLVFQTAFSVVLPAGFVERILQ